MDTSIIERWETFDNANTRALFDEYLEGQLAVQKVAALGAVTQPSSRVDLQLLRDIFAATELNAAVLLENGAQEV